MKIRLELIAETPKARKYKFKDDVTLWIPRSVIRNTLKFPGDPMLGKPEIHELTIEDWFWEKNTDLSGLTNDDD